MRYWVNNEFFKDDTTGPNMIELCGEWVCGPYDDFPMMVGAQNGARLIILEHRFYGESQPMPDWSMESL
jgi:hypothetical protein